MSSRRPLPSLEEARAILARRRTRPIPLPAPRAGRALEGLVRDLDQRFGRGVEGLQGRWSEIVGERLAAVTQPQKLSRPRKGPDGRIDGATLELRVTGAAALLVQHQSQHIVDRVNLFLGEGHVERLRIAQGPVSRSSSVSSQPPRHASAALAPLGAAAEAELRDSVARAPAPLARALERLGRAVLGQERG